MGLTLSSSSFTHQGEIPSKYTCEGDDVSPPLSWSAVPEGTKSLALIVDDPDAPDPKAPKMTWVHWVLYNLPPAESELPENVTSSALPQGTREGLNDWKRPGYGGPCPPEGDHPHRYLFTVHAVGVEALEVNADTSAAVIGFMLHFNTLEKAALMGLYKR